MHERTTHGGHLKLLPHLARVLALLPILAAGVWASFASRLPEPAADRNALNEISLRQDFAEWSSLDNEPAHVVTRAVDLAVLQIPGATFEFAALANALLAALVVIALAALVRRTFALGVGGHALALFVAGLLVCSPAFGADWLHVERIGVFLVPLLTLCALLLLHRDGSLWWRGILALLLAGLAPFCHGNGQLAFVALLPALADASRRAGSARTIAWIIVCLVVGNVAAAVSMSSAARIALDGTGLVGRIADAPVGTLLQLLAATGAAWLDPLPATNFDDVALGAMSWLVPFAAWRLGDRSEAARRAAAPWWGCLWFGLLMPAWLLEHYGVGAASGTLREFGFGTFLLPAGVVGVVAARFGRNVLPVAAGAAIVLCLQDWHRGLDPLRLATMRVQSLETAVLLPDAHPAERPVGVLPVRLVAEWRGLEAKGWVPVAASERLDASRIATESPPAPALGSCSGGDAKELRGVARSWLFGDSVQCVFVVEQKEGQAPALLGRALLHWDGLGRDASWTVALDRAPSEGAIVGAYGWRPGHSQTVALGPKFSMRSGLLVAAP